MTASGWKSETAFGFSTMTTRVGALVARGEYQSAACVGKVANQTAATVNASAYWERWRLVGVLHCDELENSPAGRQCSQ